MKPAPHLKVPFQIAGRAALTVAEDSIEEVIQNVSVIVSTRRGERLAVPDFGISDPVFEDEVDIAEMQAAIEQWEERALVRIARHEPTSEHRVSVAVALQEAG